MNSEKSTMNALNLISWFLLFECVSTIIFIIFFSLVLFDVIAIDDITNTIEKDGNLGFLCALFFILAIFGILLMIITITLSINMIKSRNERKELEKTGLISGIMMLSIFVLALFSSIPYVGEILIGFMPILMFGSLVVFYYNRVLHEQDGNMVS